MAKKTRVRKLKKTKSYGTLHDYKTGESIRAATAKEAAASKAAGPTGAFICGDRVCFVS